MSGLHALDDDGDVDPGSRFEAGSLVEILGGGDVAPGNGSHRSYAEAMLIQTVDGRLRAENARLRSQLEASEATNAKLRGMIEAQSLRDDTGDAVDEDLYDRAIDAERECERLKTVLEEATRDLDKFRNRCASLEYATQKAFAIPDLERQVATSKAEIHSLKETCKRYECQLAEQRHTAETLVRGMAEEFNAHKDHNGLAAMVVLHAYLEFFVDVMKAKTIASVRKRGAELGALMREIDAALLSK